MPKWVGTLAWVWLIVIGGIIIVFHGPPICIVCGERLLTPTDYVLAGVSVLLGLSGLATQFANTRAVT